MIRVISLPGSLRRSTIEGRVSSRTGFGVSVFDAVSVDRLGEDNGILKLGGSSLCCIDQQRARVDYGRDLVPGEIGCAVSHFLVWREVAATADSHVVVLEDDAEVLPHFDRVVGELRGCDFDIAYLHDTLGWLRVTEQMTDNWYVANNASVSGTVGYVVSRAFAAFLASCFEVIAPVDHFLSFVIRGDHPSAPPFPSRRPVVLATHVPCVDHPGAVGSEIRRAT